MVIYQFQNIQMISHSAFSHVFIMVSKGKREISTEERRFIQYDS